MMEQMNFDLNQMNQLFENSILSEPAYDEFCHRKVVIDKYLIKQK